MVFLAGVPAAIVYSMGSVVAVRWVLIVGLLIGFIFAVNSAVHSYLMVSYAERVGKFWTSLKY